MADGAVALEAGKHGENAVDSSDRIESAEDGIASGDVTHQVAPMGDAHEIFKTATLGDTAEMRAVGVDERQSNRAVGLALIKDVVEIGVTVDGTAFMKIGHQTGNVVGESRVETVDANERLEKGSE